MIVAGVVLLAAAVVAFVIGLLAGAAGWLVASLACTAAAAVLLVVRLRRAAPARRRPAPPAAARLPVWVIDGEPDYHRPTCSRLTGENAESVPRAQAVDDGFTPCPDCDPETSAALS